MQAQKTSQSTTPSLSANLGKYRLILRLAQGGMGDVYLAVHKGPGGFYKLAVIKELRSAFSEDGTSLRMFLDEARLAARLNHPNVVQTNEVACEEGRHFMVMEYLEGKPFQHVLKKLGTTGSFPWAYRVHVLCEALKGLHYAHELKDFDGTALTVVHRDFTPHNIFVTFEGIVKVLDFGIAKAIDSQETRTGMIKGKFAYMAPEQAMGKAVDRRTDIYSAGVVLWEAITGRRMWPNMSEVQILMRVVKDAAPSPKEVNPDVPDELSRICVRALERSPEDRYDSAEHMRKELESFLDSRQLQASQSEVGALLTQGFDQDRQRVRSVIEMAMRELRATSDDATVVAVPADGTATHSTIRPSIGTIGAVPGMTEVHDLSVTSSGLHSGSNPGAQSSMSLSAMPPMPTFSALRPNSGRSGGIGIGIGLAAVAAGGLYFAFGREPTTVAVTQPAPIAAAAPALTAEAAGAEQDMADELREPSEPAVVLPRPEVTPPLLPASAGSDTSAEQGSRAKEPRTSLAAAELLRHKSSAAAAREDKEPEEIAAAPTSKTTTQAPGAASAPSSTTATPPTGAPTVMAFSGGMSRPMLLSGRDPKYTKEALDARVEGTMVARCVITAGGSVTGCKLLKSLPYMDRAAIDALETRRYTPVMWEGKPVAVSYVFNIRLVLPK